jgi:Phage integrase family
VLEDIPRRPDPYVFHSARGNPLVQGSLHYPWRTVRAAAGSAARWHNLRHFCATQLLEMGLSHFDVSIQLGHTDGGALVMERYGHPSEDAARDRLLGAFSFDGEETGSATGSSNSREAHGDAGMTEFPNTSAACLDSAAPEARIGLAGRFQFRGPSLGSDQPGALAEWLRSGLQSRLHRFDSGRRLSRSPR